MKTMDGFNNGGETMIETLITFICILIAASLFSGAFFLSKHVVERQHRVNVLEDSYREATEHITALEREILGLNQQIEHMQYEAQQNGERMNRPRAWNPNDPLNSVQSRQ